MAKLQIKTLRAEESKKHGVDELWIAVLARAVEDALRPEENDRDCDRRISRQWFKSCGADFRCVCELAGRDPHYVREKMLKRIGEDKDLHKPTIRHEAKAETETEKSGGIIHRGAWRIHRQVGSRDRPRP